MNPWDKYQSNDAPVSTDTPSSDGPWSKYGGDTTEKPSAFDYYVKNPLKSDANAVINDAKDIGNAVTHPVDTIVGAVKSLPKNLGDVGNAVKGIPDMIMNHPLQTAAMALPGAEGTLGLAEKAVKATPEALKNLSGRMGNMMVKLPNKAYSYGKDPLNVMADEKIPANSITDYAKNADDRLALRTQQLNQQVSKSNATVSLDNKINTHIDNADTKAGNSLQDKTDVQNKLDEMKKKIYAQYGGEDGTLNNMSLQKAVQLKRQLADDFPFSPMEASNSSNNLLAKAAHQIHHSINDAIDVAAPGVAKLNDRVSSLIDISKAAKNRMGVESRSNPLGLIGSIMGVGGLAAHGLAGGAEGLAAGVALKAAASPFVLTRVANALSTMSDAMKGDLFKAAPWFEDVANKSQGYADKGIDLRRGLPAPPNSKGGIVDAELVQKPIVTPAPYTPLGISGPGNMRELPKPASPTARTGFNPEQSMGGLPDPGNTAIKQPGFVPKGLPEPLGPTARVGVNPPETALPSPTSVGRSPIPMGGRVPPGQPESPLATTQPPKYGTDNANMLYGQMRAKENIPLHPSEDVRDFKSTIYAKNTPEVLARNMGIKPEQVDHVADIKGMLDSSEKGTNSGVSYKGGKQNEAFHWGTKSNVPEFLKGKYTTNQLSDMLGDKLTGGKVTPGQSIVIKKLINHFFPK